MWWKFSRGIPDAVGGRDIEEIEAYDPKRKIQLEIRKMVNNMNERIDTQIIEKQQPEMPGKN